MGRHAPPPHSDAKLNPTLLGPYTRYGIGGKGTEKYKESLLKHKKGQSHARAAKVNEANRTLERLSGAGRAVAAVYCALARPGDDADEAAAGAAALSPAQATALLRAVASSAGALARPASIDEALRALAEKLVEAGGSLRRVLGLDEVENAAPSSDDAPESSADDERDEDETTRVDAAALGRAIGDDAAARALLHFLSVSFGVEAPCVAHLQGAVARVRSQRKASGAPGDADDGSLSVAEVKRVIQFLDPNGDGSVDLSELSDALKLVMSPDQLDGEGGDAPAPAPAAGPRPPSVEAAASAADESNVLNDEEVAIALTFLDPNGDGIEIDELAAAMRSAKRMRINAGEDGRGRTAACRLVEVIEARGLSVHAWFSSAVGATDGHIPRSDFEAALVGEAAFYVTGTGDGSGVLGDAEKFSKQEANLLIKCVRDRARARRGLWGRASRHTLALRGRSLPTRRH